MSARTFLLSGIPSTTSRTTPCGVDEERDPPRPYWARIVPPGSLTSGKVSLSDSGSACGFDVVRAHTQNLGVQALESGDVRLERLHLGRSAPGEVVEVERQQDVLLPR